MDWHRLHAPARKLGNYAVVGGLGHFLVRGAVRVARSQSTHGLAVGAVADGITLTRRAAQVVEEARLRAGDLHAEALATLGEEVPAPTPDSDTTPEAGHDHGG